MTAFNASFGSLAYEVLDRRNSNTRNHRPLLLIGGLTSVKEDWEPLSTALASFRPVIVYDSRGMGNSEGVSAEITVSTLAQDAADLLAHLKLTEVDVLGFSFGAIVMLELLLKVAPYVQFRHVVFAAGRPYPSTPASAMPKPSLGHVVFRSSLPEDASSQQKQEYWEPFVRLMYDDEWLANPSNQKRLSDHIESAARETRNGDVYRRQLASLKSFDYQPYLNQIGQDAHVLVIHGKKDRVVPYQDSEAFFEAIPHAVRVEGLPDNYGHWWYGYFDTATWVERLNAFLDDQSVPQSKL